MDVAARWRELVARSEDELPLDEAALLLAASANERLDVSAQLQRLDAIAAGVATADTDGVCLELFGALGLRGDAVTYDDPRNSYLDQVLDRALGIPISLSVLLIEVARRRGLRLVGIAMPGHFLVQDPTEPDVFIDAFSAGRRLDRAGCAALLGQATGVRADLDDAMLAPATKRAILARMLANLDRSFERRGDRRSLRWVALLSAAIPDLGSSERLRVAKRLAGLGCHREAAGLLEELAASPETAEPLRKQLTGQATRLRAALN